MKQEITRILMAALVLLCSVPASAYDAEIDGIFYKLSEQNAIVTRNYSKDYEGDVVIPSSVTYNGVSYSVSGIGRNRQTLWEVCKSLTQRHVAKRYMIAEKLLPLHHESYQQYKYV